MKLGKPKRYTWFRNASDTSDLSQSSPSTSTSKSSHPAIITMVNYQHHSSLVTSMSSWLLVPRGRNFRHILATVLCVILVYHVTLLAIPTNSIPSSASGAPEESSLLTSNDLNALLPSAAALTACESCEDDGGNVLEANNQISQPQNRDSNENYNEKTQTLNVGTSTKTGSQGVVTKNNEISSSQHQKMQAMRNSGGNTKNFALPPPLPAETSGNSYNYYYTDEISNASKGNLNSNYETNNPSGAIADSESDNEDNLSYNDNQATKSKSGNDNASADQKQVEGNINRGGNVAKVELSSRSVHPNKTMLKNAQKVSVKNGGQFEKRASKKLLNLQYQKRRKLLDSIFLSIKSTKRFHKTRLEPVITTWFNLARDQTWIFTDDDDLELNKKTNGHVINTHCPSTHDRQALCCKMSAEFDTFIKSQKSWFCHFDDDNYVNVPALLDLLSKYDHTEDWYLGKPSLKIPIKIPHPDNKSEEISFWFATGGAGFCLSRALAKRMSPVASGGKFTKLCDNIQLPDDVTIGYIAGHLLGSNLTVIPQFHSHYETMRFLDMKNPYPEITFSYVRYFDNSLNTLEIDGFSEDEDPTRFLSLHCLLFPNFSFCPNSKR